MVIYNPILLRFVSRVNQIWRESEMNVCWRRREKMMAARRLQNVSSETIKLWRGCITHINSAST